MDRKYYESLLNTWCLASQLYYDGDEPLMTDQQFDKIEKELLQSPFDDIIDFVKKNIYRDGKFCFEHYEQELISLKKIHFENKPNLTSSEVIRFLNNKNNENKIYVAPKYDGCSLKIIWKHNRETLQYEIEQILTRGGIDVTNTFKKLNSIKNTFKFGKRIICGELVINKQLFRNKYGITSNYEKPYANPRNFVASLLRRTVDTISNDILNDLIFIPCTDGIDPLISSDIWNEANIFNDILSFNHYKSDEFPFLCDGLVYACMTKNHKREVTDNYPLNMVAVKFPSVEVETEVINIDWSQKKSGKLIPTLEVKSVNIDGSIITRVAAYNMDFLETEKCGIGAKIKICKSGDIIPIITSVISKSSNFNMPEIEYKRIGKYLFACDDTDSIQFKFVNGLKQLQLTGIGERTAHVIGEICDWNIIEIFNKDNRIKIASKLGSVQFQKFSIVYTIRHLFMNQLIEMLQFNNVGPKIAMNCALALTRMSRPSIPNDVVNNVCRGAGFQKIKESIEKLAGYGISVIKPQLIDETSITFEMSGTPPGMSKAEFVNTVKKRYTNSIHTTLTKQTTILFVDSKLSNTSKVLKARKYNIQIMEYNEFLNGAEININNK